MKPSRASSLLSSRRSFLKTSGLAAAATVAYSTTAATEAQTSDSVSSQTHSAAIHEAAGSPVILVNILQGTDSTSSFSRGNTLPIAARPFGMGHWMLQSRAFDVPISLALGWEITAKRPSFLSAASPARSMQAHRIGQAPIVPKTRPWHLMFLTFA
jgi:hypothetical protein